MTSFLPEMPLLPTNRSNARFLKLPFPWKLQQLLEDAKNDGNQHIISWWGNNQSFKVHDKELFTKQIMPKYFRQTQYRSFTHQLYVYGFLIIQIGDHRGSFVHPPNFVRGDKMPTLSMVRRVKEHGQEKTNSQRSASEVLLTTQKSVISGPIVALNKTPMNSPRDGEEPLLMNSERGQVDVSSILFKKYQVTDHKAFLDKNIGFLDGKGSGMSAGQMLKLVEPNPHSDFEGNNNLNSDWLQKILSSMRNTIDSPDDLEPRRIKAMSERNFCCCVKGTNDEMRLATDLANVGGDNDSWSAMAFLW